MYDIFRDMHFLARISINPVETWFLPFYMSEDLRGSSADVTKHYGGDAVRPTITLQLCILLIYAFLTLTRFSYMQMRSVRD